MASICQQCNKCLYHCIHSDNYMLECSCYCSVRASYHYCSKNEMNFKPVRGVPSKLFQLSDEYTTPGMDCASNHNYAMESYPKEEILLATEVSVRRLLTKLRRPNSWGGFSQPLAAFLEASMVNALHNGGGALDDGIKAHKAVASKNSGGALAMADSAGRSNMLDIATSGMREMVVADSAGRSSIAERTGKVSGDGMAMADSGRSSVLDATTSSMGVLAVADSAGRSRIDERAVSTSATTVDKAVQVSEILTSSMVDMADSAGKFLITVNPVAGDVNVLDSRKLVALVPPNKSREELLLEELNDILNSTAAECGQKDRLEITGGGMSSSAPPVTDLSEQMNDNGVIHNREDVSVSAGYRPSELYTQMIREPLGLRCCSSEYKPLGGVDGTNIVIEWGTPSHKAAMYPDLSMMKDECQSMVAEHTLTIPKLSVGIDIDRDGRVESIRNKTTKRVFKNCSHNHSKELGRWRWSGESKPRSIGACNYRRGRRTMKVYSTLGMLYLCLISNIIEAAFKCGDSSSGYLWSLPNTLDCDDIALEEKKSVWVSVAVENDYGIDINAYKCQKIVTEYKTYTSFFNGKGIVGKRTYSSVVESGECHSWHVSNKTEKCDLRGTTVLTCEHGEIDYSWCCSDVTSQVVTYILTLGVVHIKSKGMYSNLGDVSSCNQLNGNCKISNGVVIWNATLSDMDRCGLQFVKRSQGYLVKNSIIIPSENIAFEVSNEKVANCDLDYYHSPQGIYYNYELSIPRLRRDILNAESEYLMQIVENEMQRLEHNLFQQVCHLTNQMIVDHRHNLLINPVQTMRTILKTESISAKITGEFVTVWRCPEVKLLAINLTHTDGADCYLDPPVKYEHMGIEYYGYVDMLSGEVIGDSIKVPCHTLPDMYYQEKGVIFKWDRNDKQVSKVPVQKIPIDSRYSPDLGHIREGLIHNFMHAEYRSEQRSLLILADKVGSISEILSNTMKSYKVTNDPELIARVNSRIAKGGVGEIIGLGSSIGNLFNHGPGLFMTILSHPIQFVTNMILWGVVLIVTFRLLRYVYARYKHKLEIRKLGNSIYSRLRRKVNKEDLELDSL